MDGPQVNVAWQLRHVPRGGGGFCAIPGSQRSRLVLPQERPTSIDLPEVKLGLGCSLALCYRSSTLYQICYDIRHLFFLSRQWDRTLGQARADDGGRRPHLPGRAGGIIGS